MQFQDELAGGVVLIRPALQSPNYVANVSGWAIKIDGSAEFNSVVIRGSGTADPLVVGPAGMPQVIIRTTATNGLIVFPTNRPIELAAATLNSAVIDSGAAAERAELQMTGPTVTGATDGVRVVLKSQANNGSAVAEFSVQDRAGTTTFLAVDETEVRVVHLPIDSRQLVAEGVVLSGYVTTDTVDRIVLRASGEIEMGSGSAVRDVNLYRQGAGELKTDASFTVDLNLLVGGTSHLIGNVDIDGDLSVDGIGQVQHARRTSDLARTNTATPTDDPQLQFTVAANAVYALSGWVKYSAEENTDIQIDFSTPAGALGEWTGHGMGLTTAAQTTAGYLIRTEANDISQARTFAGTTGTAGTFSVLLAGTLRTAGTAGTYALQWAQGTVDAVNSTTVYTDSWVRLERIA